MRIMRLPRFSAKTHIATGLTSLVVTSLLTAMFLGLVPDPNAARRKGRGALAEAIAVSGSVFMAKGDLKGLAAVLRPIIERNPDLLSAAVRRGGGRTLVVIGDHKRHWIRSSGELSTDSQVIVPIWSAQRRWGRV